MRVDKGRVTGAGRLTINKNVYQGNVNIAGKGLWTDFMDFEISSTILRPSPYDYYLDNSLFEEI